MRRLNPSKISRKHPGRITHFQLKHWLEDSNLSVDDFIVLMGISRAMANEWLFDYKVQQVPVWARYLISYISQDLHGHSRRRIPCRCGCGEKTYKSVVSGEWCLFLPGHSPIAKVNSWKAGRYAPQVRLPMGFCPTCQTVLTSGLFKGSLGEKVGQFCEKCGLTHMLAE